VVSGIGLLFRAGFAERNAAGPSDGGANLQEMGSPLLPLSLALGALGADAVGLHRVAFYVVLLAVVGAAAAAFVGAGDALEGNGGSWLRAASSCLALVLLVLGSAVRANGPAGGHLPTLAVSTVVLAVLVYVVPVLGWLVQPVVLRPQSARVRSQPLIEP
jgi:hypothetical protein